MEDKYFELMTKMYNEMQQGFKEVRNEMEQGFKETKLDMVRLENNMDNNHKALYDGYKQSIEGINELRDEVKNLSNKVEHQEIKLQVIQGSR